MRSLILRHVPRTIRRWSIPLLATLMAILGLTLSACGQKGPLTLPNHDPVTKHQLSGHTNGMTQQSNSEGQP